MTIPARRNNRANKLPADVGFCYMNVRLMLGIPYWKEFNIGHSMCPEAFSSAWNPP